MKKQEIFFLAGGLIAVLSLFGFMSFAQAADTTDANLSESITASPGTQDPYNIDAGDSVEGSFKVINSGETTYDFTVYAKPYSVSGNNYSPNYDDTGAARADAYEWITLDTTEGTLEPGESAVIDFTINVPESAGLGGHYAVLFANTKVPEDYEGQVSREKRVGSIVRVNVNGDIKEEGSVVGDLIPFFQPSPPLISSFDVKNSGNVDFTVKSSLTITDVFGNVKYANNKSNIVYPDTTRTIEQNWDGASWIGFYNVRLDASYLGQDYTVSKYVLVLPRWVIALLVILLAGGAYAAFARRRR